MWFPHCSQPRLGDLHRLFFVRCIAALPSGSNTPRAGSALPQWTCSTDLITYRMTRGWPSRCSACARRRISRRPRLQGLQDQSSLHAVEACGAQGRTQRGRFLEGPKKEACGSRARGYMGTKVRGYVVGARRTSLAKRLLSHAPAPDHTDHPMILPVPSGKSQCSAAQYHTARPSTALPRMVRFVVFSARLHGSELESVLMQL